MLPSTWQLHENGREGSTGSFLRSPYVRDFVKEGYFFVPWYEVWRWKSPYNPRNISGSDAEWLPKWLGFRQSAAAKQAETYNFKS